MKINFINLIFLLAISFSSCKKFEREFYDKIDNGQIIAAEIGTDTFDLSEITNFEWDSMILIRGNESVPIFKEQIEEEINNHISDIDWEERRDNNKVDPKLYFKTSDLAVNRDRFYFMTPNRKLIEKEIKSGIYCHKPEFDVNYCLIDSVKERYWLTKGECKFIVKTNGTKGNGMVFLFPKCKTRFSPDKVRIWK
jgi:hypothetical protein